MMLCLNIVITITINGIIENKKIEKKGENATRPVGFAIDSPENIYNFALAS